MPLSNLSCRVNEKIIVKSRLGPVLASFFALLSFGSLSFGQSITSRPPDQIGPNSRVWIVKATNAVAADLEVTAIDAATRNALNAFADADQDATAPANDTALSMAEAPAVSRVEEIATGMNYWDGEKWTESQASFDVTPDAFVAPRLQYIVSIGHQINAPNAINILTRDGITIRSTPVALALYDRASGASVIIGAITNSIGVLVSSNKVVFENAFHGPVAADLVYTIEKGTFEQDAVIRTRIDPADYNFPRDTTCIQVLTEIFEAPVPEKIRRPLYVEEREAVRSKMATPDIVDEVLGWGEFVLATGRAFSSEFDNSPTNAAASVSKEIRTIDNRRFIIESVEFSQVKSHIEALPAAALQEAALRKPAKPGKSRTAYAAIPKPAAKVAKAEKLEKSKEPLRAKQMSSLKSKGVTIDFIATIGGNLNNTYTFRGDTTYFVQSAVVCNGPVVLEAGTVLKFKHPTVAPTGSASVKLISTLTCKSTSFRPCIFTAMDDDTVGERLNSYVGYQQPPRTDGYANPALWIYNISSQQLNNCRFSYCQEAIRLEGSTGSTTVSHAQLVNCIRGIVITGCGCGCATPIVNNGLFAGVKYPVTISKPAIIPRLINCTLDVSAAGCLVTATASSGCNFTNSIFANVSSVSAGSVTVSGDYNGFYASFGFGSHQFQANGGLSPFQSRGAGNYYLTSVSNFRGIGTALGISASLLADLRKRTVDAPAQISPTTYSSDYPFTPQVTLDTGASPHLGAHYDPLDFLVSQLSFGSFTAVLTNGVAVAVYGSYGFSVTEQGTIVSEGKPLAMNRLCFYPSVQEQPIYSTTPTTISTWNAGLVNVSGATSQTANIQKPDIFMRFSDFPMLGLCQSFFYGAANPRNLKTVSVKDCWLRGVNLTISASTAAFPQVSTPSFKLWNNLIERGSVTITNGWFSASGAADNPLSATIENNLFWQSSLTLAYNDSQATYHPGWNIQDNLFDNSAPSLTGNGSYQSLVSRTYNGYYPESSATLGGNGAGNVTLTALSYITGFDNSSWYVGSSTPSLYRVDTSRTAAQAGLYHYTVLTNLSSKAGEPTPPAPKVSIGWHHVALGANSQPIDTDGDLKPDYAEDWTGDGIAGNGETSYIDPALAVSSSPVDYIRGHHPAVIDSTADITADAVDFTTGQLTVSISQGARPDDQIDIKSASTSSGQIQTNRSSGINHVKYDGGDIGTYSGGIGGQPLVVQFTSPSSKTAVQALLRNITFANVGNDLSLAQRVVRFVIIDGHGGTSPPVDKTVNVKCADKVDMFFVVDVSGSLSPNDFSLEKSAATNLIRHLRLSNSDDRVGVIRFCGDPSVPPARVVFPLTSDRSAAETGLAQIDRCANTHFHHAINLARDTFASSGRADAYKIIVLMTDGIAEPGASAPADGQAAADAAKSAGIRIITVGFGQANQTYLQSLASTPANSYITQSSGNLDALMCQVDTSLCRDANVPPAVALTSPQPNSTFTWGASVTVSASASDICGQVSKVEFFANNVKIGEQSQTPYTILWTPPIPGTYILRADATDNDAATASSTEIQITVSCASKLDVMLALDVSYSLGDIGFVQAKSACTEFLSFLDPVNDRAGLVTIHEGATLVRPLTPEVLLVGEDAYAQGHVLGTKLKPAIDLAQAELSQHGRSDALKVIILLTDGDVVPDSDQNGNYNEQAIDAAVAAKQSGTRIISLGYQSGTLDATLLKTIATSLNDYYEALTADLINDRFRQIATALCRNQNQAPTIVATATPSVATLPGDHTSVSVNLDATVTDDGLPNGTHISAWSFLSGPSGVKLSPNSQQNPSEHVTATLFAPGDYVFRVTASDSLLGASNEVHVTINKANSAPEVTAGPNQSIAWPDRVYLPGAVWDDGLPTPNALAVTWSKQSGDGEVTFDDPHSTNTIASFSAPGEYILVLTATDGQLESSSTVMVAVNSTGPFAVFRDSKVESVGVGGMKSHSVSDRRAGSGTMTLRNISGRIDKAFLYWHGPTESADPRINSEILVNGRLVVGTSIGIANANGWASNDPGEQSQKHWFANSQGYRADVTALVRSFGQGDYVLTNCVKSSEVEVNGASLIVFYDDGDPGGRSDFVLWNGNDSSSARFFADRAIDAICLRAGGQILIGGEFQGLDSGRNGIAQLYADGMVDVSFDPKAGFNGSADVTHVVGYDSAGRILVGGEFAMFGGKSRANLARLTPAGTLDDSFLNGLNDGFNGSVQCLAPMPSGKIVVGGAFTSVNGTAISHLVRLNANGAIDNTFAADANGTPVSVAGTVFAIAVQSDGKFVVAGDFASVNGVVRTGIARLKADGSVDTTFDPQAGGLGIRTLALDSGESIVLAGTFTSFAGAPRHRIARLGSDGLLDANFISGTSDGADNAINAVAISSVGKIYAAGAFTAMNGISRHCIARLNANGSLDLAFDPGFGPDAPTGQNAEIRAMALQPGGKIAIGGNFASFNHGISTPRLARLKSNGELDREFSSTDAAWRVVFDSLEYTSQSSGSLELHVSDGQPLGGLKPLADNPIYLNGVQWLSPANIPGHPEAGPQIFAGLSVNAPEGTDAQGRLWDIIEKPVPVSIFTAGGGQVLTLTTDRLDYGDDAISIIAALLKMPVGSVPAASGPGRVPYPEDMPPRARADRYTVRREIGRRVLAVLENDETVSGTFPLISSITQPAGGHAEIMHNGSAIMYVANPDFSGEDQLTYTIQDGFGNSASAEVVLDVAGTAPTLISLPSTVTGVLTVGDSSTSVRGGGQYADFFQFWGVAGERIDLQLNPDEFAAHAYLRGPDGELHWAATHNAGGRNASFAGGAQLESTGLYTLEVTSHYAEEEGTYNFTITRSSAGAIEFILNGVSYRQGDTADLGILHPGVPLTNRIVVRNLSASEVGSTETSTAGFTYPLNSTVSPNVIPILPPGASSRHELVINAPAGGVRGEITASLGLTGLWGMFVKYQFNDTELPPPTVTITSPPNGALYTFPGPIRITAVPEVSNGDTRKATFFAQQDAGMFPIGLAASFPWSCSWIPPKPGKYILKAMIYEEGSDGITRAGISPGISVTIADPSHNASPLAKDDDFRTYVNLPVEATVLTNDTDPDGDDLKVIAATDGENGGTVEITSDGKRVRYIPPWDTYGLDRFSYTVADSRGSTAHASAVVHIVERTIQITSPLNGATPESGTLVPVQVEASTSEGAIMEVQLLVDGISIATNFARPFNFSFVPYESRYYKLKAVARDDAGNIADSEEVTIAVGGLDAHPPIAEFSNLVDDQIVREGRFELFGSADDPDPADRPVSYNLELFKPEPGGLTSIRSITGGYQPGPIDSGHSFGIIDFTTLENGSYVLRLTVVNAQLAETKREVRFILDTDAKIGQFTFAETDLVVPVLGVPISLVRRYDSFNTAQGELGFAWTYAVNDMQVEFDELRIPAETEFGQPTSIRAGGGRNVSLTLPDGRRTTFAFSLKPGPSNSDAPCFCYVAEWTAPPGVHASLAPLDNNRLQFIIGQNQIPPFWEGTGPETPMDSFDFRGFVLTNSDGTEYTIMRDTGGFVELEPSGTMVQGVDTWSGGKLTEIRGRDGFKVKFTENNIDHIRPDAPNSPTHALYFHRTSGLVDAVYTSASLDSNGVNLPGALPVVKYIYNGTVLRQVERLVDRNKPEGQQYAKTRYTTQLQDGHYVIKKIERWVSGDTWSTVAEPSYDSDSRLVGTTDTAGHTAAITHDLPGRSELITDALGNSTLHAYDSRGNVTRTTDANGHTTSRSYDDRNNLISEIDPLGNETTHDYDINGYRIRTRDPLGNVTTSTFDKFGHLLTSTDANENAAGGAHVTVQNSYDSVTGNLTSSTDADGHTTGYGYDPQNRRLTAITDPVGNVTSHDYYGASEIGGRDGDLKSVTVKRKTGANQYEIISKTVYTYDNNGNRATETVKSLPLEPDPDHDSARDITTRYYYDDQNRLVRTEDALYDAANPSLHKTETVYNDYGKPISTSDGLGRVTTYLYDANGNLIETTSPGDASTPVTITRTVYDELNRPIYTQERAIKPSPPTASTASNATHTVYDPAGRAIRTEYVSNVEIIIDTTAPIPTWKVLSQGEVRRFQETTYDAAGRVASTADSYGAATEYEYDPAGHQRAVTRIADEARRITSTYRYDPNGNQTALTDALGRTAEYSYDKLNRRVAVLYPLVTGESQRFQDLTGYDELGRRVVETNKAGVVTGFGYDILGRLRYVTNDFHASGPNPFLTQYGYDEFGNLTSQTDAENRTTTFWYNKLGQRIRRNLPGTQFEQFAYDAAGNQIKRTNFVGKVTTFDYDVFHRLRQKTPDPSLNEPPIAFTYTISGQRQTMTDASGQTSYFYDTQHRLQRRETPEGTLKYSYGIQGKLFRIYGGDVWMEYTWNRLGQLAAADSFARTTYSYDAVGNLQAVTNANHVATQYQYDEMNRLREVDIRKNNQNDPPTPLAHYTYQVGAAGNRLHVTEASGRGVTYGYDNVYRLTSEAITLDPHQVNGTVNYTHDHVGNRLSRTHAAGISATLAQKVPAVLSSTYDVNDRLDGNTYDNDGNTTGSPGNTDQYDFEDRLISRNNGQVQFVYDGDGNRVQKTVGGVTTYYLVDDQNPTGYAQVVEEFLGSLFGPTRVYTYGLSRISENHGSSPTIWRYYGYDGHGSVRLLTDANGAITDTDTYDAFGILIDETHPGTPTGNVYLYAGEQFDPDLGLYYNRARYLNINSGRFWTMDTFEGSGSAPLTQNAFIYARCDAINRIDPTGNADFIQQLASTKIGATIIAIGGPTIAAANRALPTIVRGTAQAAQLAQRIVAAGGDIVAWEERVMRLGQAGTRFIGKFKLDMVVRLPGRTGNTLIESKGAPWNMFFRNTELWNGWIEKLRLQANALGQATQSAKGVTFQERIICFTSKAPVGAEQAVEQIKAVLGRNYQQILWGEEEVTEFLERL